MRKNISMPDFLVEAVKDMQEAFNLYSQSNSKKVKEYSFSAVMCHLISQGIDKEFKLTQNADKDSWLIKENFDKFKQLIKAAQQKSQEFEIDRPHRKEKNQININKDQNIDKDIDIEDTDIDQDIDQDLDIDQNIDLDKDLGLDQDIDQDQDFNPDQDFD